MIFFLISILAGILTVLAPCILPFLPIVIGASENGERRVSKRATIVIFSLSVSVIAFTLLLKASTAFIGIPQGFWTGFSGSVILLVGLSIVFPSFWARLPFINKISQIGNNAIEIGHSKKNYIGDILVGLALGTVFST